MIESVSDQAGAGADLKKTRRQRASRADSSIDRLPPHSPEAEQGVLGCVLLSPKECLGECIVKMQSGSDCFYDLRHQVIYDTMIAMSELLVPIDTISLQQWLKDNQELEQVGGLAFLLKLQDSVPSAANLSYYLDIVQEKYLLRRMIQTCTEAIGRIYDYEGEVDALMDEIERDILAIRPRVNSETPDIKTLVTKAINSIEDRWNRKGAITGIETGLPDLDRMTNGLHGGTMFVIAGRPSMGKTSLAMNIAEHIVLQSKLSVGVFSLEMDAEQLVERMLCSCARVNLRNINDGFMAESDFPKLSSAAGRISNSKLHICDIGGLSIIQLRARARRLWQQHGCRVFVVDYIQLLHAASKRGRDNRQQEISDISSGLKEMARELRVPVLALSQLNRELDKDKSRKPRLSDLRESGAIEQDADVVGLLYKPKSDDEDSTGHEQEGMPVNLLIAKQRNGPTGEIHLTFLKPFTRFESAAKINDQDVPSEMD